MKTLTLTRLALIVAAGCATPVAKAPAPSTIAGAAAPRVTGFSPSPHALTLETTSGPIVLTAVNDHVIRVRAGAGATKAGAADFSWAVVPGANAPTAAFVIKDDGASLVAATKALRVRVDKNPLRLVFLDADGKVINEDVPRQAMTVGASDGGGFRVAKVMPDDEHYYGLGEKAGPLDRREMAFTNWNTDAYAWQESTDPLYKTIPFFIGVRKGRAHGVFVDTTWRSWFDFGKTARDAYSFGSEGGALDYYVIAGPHPKAVLERYAGLTGKPPLPPLWSLGFQQSRYSYFPEARVREIAATFRKKKIPTDVLYLDIDYQKENWPFTVDRARFPHFETMIKDLDRDGFKIIAITDLHIAKAPGKGYRPYDEGTAGNHFVHAADGSVYEGKVWPGQSVFPDFTWAPARTWWGTLYKDFVAMGLGGYWNDMNEPSVFWAQRTMPLDVVHRVDSGGTTTHREVHNVFGMQNARATYEGLLALQGDVRPLVLTRATYAGGQRHAASWTGDNSSTWNHLRISIPMLLNLGLSGYAYVGDDIGGFRGSPPPDLLTRWIAVGAFNPIFRNHSEKGTADQEPWVHGAEHEAIRKRFIETRYRLMPYVYAAAEETARTGLPMMRPFWLEHPEAEGYYTNNTAFLFGADLLVQPKLDEMVDPLEITVPPGDWYDYWTGAVIKGDQKVKTTPAVGDLSVLVRGGAIVPHAPLAQSTAEIPKGPLELRVYPGADCRGSLYFDDGVTFGYRRGVFLRQGVSCAASAESITVTAAPAEGSYTPWFKEIAYAIHGADKKPREVTVDGAATKTFTWDAKRKVVTVTALFARGGQRVAVAY